jgi:hypothetical protein
MEKKICLAFLLLAVPALLPAQNIKDETTEYSYTKLPMQPLDRSVKNYQATIIATYEEDNAKKKAAYEAEKKAAEADYQKEKDAYPAKVKAAETKYNNELAEWNKKSLGEKVVEKNVLGENNKPVKQVPPEPQERYVQKPELRTSYDYPMIASTYLKLGGFENKAENAVKILVTLYGYDYTQPRQMTVQKNITSYANGTSSTTPVTYYYTEFSYRHPMSVTVTAPDGKVIMTVTPQELNTYTIYKTPETDKPSPINPEMLVKTYEEKVLQANLGFINDLVNDKIGYPRTLRKADLHYVKSKDDTYKDLLTAFNDASSGLKLLLDDASTAKAKLASACQVWNAALQESDPKNKKARIDKGVTIAVCFNLLEGYFALGSTPEADKVLATLNTLDLSYNDRKLKEDYEALFNDFKKRVQANK